MDMPEHAYRTIAHDIASDTSPVGIDAKKTHVMILYQLQRIEDRLSRIEASLGRAEPAPTDPRADGGTPSGVG